MSRRRVFLSVALVASLGGAGLASVHVAQADPPRFSRHSRGELRHRPDDLVDAAERGRRARQLWAAEAVARGEAEVRMGRNGARVVQTPDGRWVEHGVQDVGHVLVIAVEFGTERPAGLTASDPVGPLHNAILEPDREVDNSTYWVSDFDQQHYRELLFGGATESVAGYYQEVSSGRYSLVGDVTDWVTLPKHESYYNNKGAYRMDELVRDWATAWYAREISRGKTHQEIVDYLGQFDQWWRGDTTGNPNRPDGVIDHLMIVHAGEGQEAGAPDWAIWSHRSFVGNVEIATTGLRIRDYTIQPENGAIGVFAHEYAHDLGLPDFYDTTTGGQENSTSFWTLMSSGSWLGRGEGTIGTTPGHMGAPEKLQLGWLDYTTVSPGGTRNLVLNPAALDADQAVFVNLPPAQGSTHYYLAENRQCVGYDEALCLGPYNWTNLETTPKLLETFSFEPGLLVWYVNSAQYDNNVTIHPGAGRALPVVANSTALFWPSGEPVRNRSQAWDATFKAPGETYRAFSHSREH
ncbi:MAG: immune inhibitor A, partial [Micrococcales bacterium]|nr:immune inhibitor A [Micrococcales bacterium]